MGRRASPCAHYARVVGTSLEQKATKAQHHAPQAPILVLLLKVRDERLLQVRHEHLRQRHLSVMAVRSVCGRRDEERHPTDMRGPLQSIGAVSPEADPLSDVANLVKMVLAGGGRAALAGHVGTLAVVRLLATQELAGDVVVDLHLEAGRRMAMVVRADKVHVPSWRRHDTRDSVRTLLHRRAGWALRDVILGGIAADACIPAESADVDGWVELLEVEAPLEVVLQRLVLPRDFLICIQQVPAVVAGRQSTNVRPCAHTQ